MPKRIALSDGEWKLMDLLWSKSPRTIAELVQALAEDTGWSKATIYIMLGRMEKKGAVYCESGGRSKLYSAAVPKSELTAGETKCFLDKVYGGSLGLMMSTMVRDRGLSDAELAELSDILKRAEEGRHDP